MISLCSTDDRYADDVHYRGGAVLALEMLSWGASMLSFNAIPPDPEVAGPGWRDAWLERIDSVEPYEYEWLRHQRRDDYWKQGSVCEDFGAIECPVYAIGGWADGYSEAVLRLVAGLGRARQGPDRPVVALVPRRGRAGPGDRLPPGVPALVGPVAEGRGHRDRGRARPARLDAGARGSGRPPRASAPAAGWPSAAGPRRRSGAPHVARRGRPAATSPTRAAPARDLAPTCSAASTAESGARTARHAEGGGPARGRRSRARLHLRPAAERIELLGERARGARARERPAGCAARGAALRRAPDGSSLLITRGVLNLTHRDSHEHPQPLEPGAPQRMCSTSTASPRRSRRGTGCGWRSRRRTGLALAAPEPVTLAIHTADSSLVLPVRAAARRGRGAPTLRRARGRARSARRRSTRSRAPAP